MKFYLLTLMILPAGMSTSFIVLFLRKYLQVNWIKSSGEKALAQILNVEILRASDNDIYVRLKLRVLRKTDTSFISEIETFVSLSDMNMIQAGKCVSVKYHPAHLNRVALLKNWSAIESPRKISYHRGAVSIA